MASTAILAIRIVSDASKAARELQGMDTATGKWQGRMQAANRVAKGTAVGLAAIGAAAFQQASKLQQADGAVQAVFKGQANAVRGLAKEAATSTGLAQSEYSELAAIIGAQLTNMGVAQNKLVGTTDGLISTGADLAAQFGGSTKEAVEALSSALRGETDPIERYGISIKQATVEAELARKGQDKLKGSALQAAKTQALLGLVAKQSASSQGAFAREATSAAGAQQIAMANVKNAAAELGAVLLPVAAQAAEKLAALATFVQQNSGFFTKLAAVVGILAVGVMAVNAAFTVYTATTRVAGALSKVHAFWTNAETAAVTRKTVATKAAAVAQRILNLAMRANPIGLIITAIIALVALFVVLYKKNETFRKIVQAVMKAAQAAIGWVIDKIGDLIGWVKDKLVKGFQVYKGIALAVWRAVSNAGGWVIDKAKQIVGWIKDKLGGAFKAAKEIATRAFDAIRNPIQWVIDKVQALINKIRGINWPSPPGWLKSVGSFGGSLFGSGTMMGTHTLHAAGAGLTAASSSGSSQAPTMIVIQGALDPDAVARQVEKLLGQRARRVGVVRP